MLKQSSSSNGQSVVHITKENIKPPTTAGRDRKETFVIVLARDLNGVHQKHMELEKLGLRHVIISGEPSLEDHVVYRTPRGKFDAINFGLKHIPEDAEIVVLNDVDTRIVNYDHAFRHFTDPRVGLIFTSVELPEGAHSTFNRLIDSIRHHFIIAANGELMFIRRDVLKRVTPIPPCKAEDTLILFRTLKIGYRAIFETDCHVLTSRTSSASLRNEQIFKRKVVCGIYQALYLGDASLSIKLFYSILPFASPFLLAAGRKGWFWMVGILWGLVDFLKGDKTGYWLPTYK